MQSNPKGGNPAVRFLLSHGEKLGMAILLGCTGLLLASSFQVSRLDDRQTPNNLSALVNTAKQKIAAASWEKYPDEEKAMAEPMEPGESVIGKISAEDYPIFRHDLNQSVWRKASLRTDPPLLAPADLEVHGDCGLWATTDAQPLGRADDTQPPGKQSQGRRVKGPAVVRPEHGVEVHGDTGARVQPWVTVLARVPLAQQQQLYADTLQTARKYDPSIDVPDYVGYSVERSEVTDRGPEPWQHLATVTEESLMEAQQANSMSVADVVDPRVRHDLLTHPLPPLVLRDWDQRASHSSLPVAAPPDSGRDEEQQPVPNLLLRFVDDQVLPGHRYRYRVRLAMRDVNHQIDEKYLDKAVLERHSKDPTPVRHSAWSSPSPIASVPLPARVYVMSADPAKDTDVNAEPKLTVLIKALVGKFAAEVACVDSFVRGSVINLEERVSVVWSHVYDPSMDPSEFPLITGTTLLDIQGGEELSRDLSAPARALLMDPTGRLFVQTELADVTAVSAYQTALAKWEAAARRDANNRSDDGIGGNDWEGGGYGEGF